MGEKFEYFRRPAVITGKHGRLIDDMWEQNQIQKSYFKRLVDLYTIAAIIGLRAKRAVEEDRTEEGRRTVQVDQLMTKLEDLTTIMQIILLLDETSRLTIEQKINRAFRGPQSEEEFNSNVDLFNSYVRGGIEILHEELVQRALGIEDEFSDVRIGNMIALLNNPLVGNAV